VADDVGTGHTDNEYDHTPWLGNQLIQFANMYGKYRFKNRLRIHYVPLNATTASARSYFLGFSPDPAPSSVGTDEAPWTLANILNMANSQAFAAWQPVTLDVIVAPGEEKWYFLPDATSASAAPSEWTRQVDQFAIGAVTNFASSANLIDGLLFLEGEVEFCNWIGSMRTQTTLSRRPNALAPTVGSGRAPRSQDEMKTPVPVTTRDPRVPLLPGMSPPMVTTIATMDDRALQALAELVLKEKERRSGSGSEEYVVPPRGAVDEQL